MCIYINGYTLVKLGDPEAQMVDIIECTRFATACYGEKSARNYVRG